jgi:hypothetical protein
MFAIAYRLFDELVYRLVLGMIGAGMLFAVLLTGYEVKSELGIKLTEGHSFMHEFYFG